MSRSSLFVQMRGRTVLPPGAVVRVGDVAEFAGDPSTIRQLCDIRVGNVPEVPGSRSLVLAVDVIRALMDASPETDLRLLGGIDCVVQCREHIGPFNVLKVLGVSLVLFTGAALALMNFHADVSMPQVHQQLYLLITGRQATNPLVLQIPYSLGIGVGIGLFFNHIRPRGADEDPSPLEVEMYLYDKNVQDYTSEKMRLSRAPRHRSGSPA